MQAAVSSRFTGLYLLVGGIMTQVANLLPGYLAQAKVSAKVSERLQKGEWTCAVARRNLSR